MIATAKHRPATFADLHRKLGEVPLDRIRLFPAPGTATEADLLTAGKPICELIDGVLVEKALSGRESIAKHLPATFADLHRKLGEVPLDRIRLIPAPGTATEADLLTAGKPICELIDGVLVEKPMGARESLLAGVIIQLFRNHIEADDLGVVLGADGFLRILPGQIRAPDVSFIPWSTLPGGQIPEGEAYWSIVPALAVEVLSPTNTKAEIDRKLRELLAAGCKLAWVIEPETQKARVYTSAKRSREIDETGTLNGGKVLPGFTLLLANLFAATRRRESTR
jgi:Uma2 family endonuclease